MIYKQQIESKNEKKVLSFEDLRAGMIEFDVPICRPPFLED